MNTEQARGLTVRQTYTLEHIERCYCCGAWTVVTKRGGRRPAICAHLNPEQPRKAVA